MDFRKNVCYTGEIFDSMVFMEILPSKTTAIGEKNCNRNAQTPSKIPPNTL